MDNKLKFNRYQKIKKNIFTIAGKNFVLIIVFMLIVLIAISVARTVILKIIQQQQHINKVIFNVNAIKAQKINMKEIIYAQTTIQGNPQVKVFPNEALTGLFIRNNVKEGDYIKKNTIIAFIDRNIPGSDFEPALVTSPIDGIIIKLYYLDRGSYIAIDQPIAEVANINTVKLDVTLSEVNLLKVKTGQPVEVTADFLGNTILKSTVNTVSPFIDLDTFSGNAVVYLNNPDRKLKLGLLVNVGIEVGERMAFVVPESIVILGQDGSYIFINNNNTAKKVKISTGYINKGMIEINGDLHEGDEIITSGDFKLYDGAAIKVSLQ